MSRFTIVDEPAETGIGSALKNIATTGARIGEAIVGLPGDIAQLGTTAINYGLEKLGTNPKILPQSPEFLPTSTQLRQLQPEYLQPKSQGAETIGEIAQTLTRALLPPFGASSLSSIPGILGRAIIGETGARGIKVLGGGPVAQEIGRVGSFFLSSLYGGKSQATKTMKDAYKNARESIKDKPLSPSLRNSLKSKNEQFYDKLGRVISEDKKFLRDSSKSIESILTDARPSVEELWDAKIALNNKIGSLNPKSPEYRLTSQLVNNINETLQSYGKENKDFIKNFNLGEEIYKGLQASTSASKFLRENVSLKSLFKKPLYKLIAFNLHPGKVAAGATIATGLREATKFHDLLSKSPSARKMMANILKGALEQNSQAVIRNTLGLEKEFNKDQSRFVLVD